MAGGASEGALYTAGEMRGKSVEVTVGRVIVVMGTAQVVIGIVVIGTVEMGPVLTSTVVRGGPSQEKDIWPGVGAEEGSEFWLVKVVGLNGTAIAFKSKDEVAAAKTPEYVSGTEDSEVPEDKLTNDGIVDVIEDSIAAAL